MDWVVLGLVTLALMAVLLSLFRDTRLPGEFEAAELERWFARHARRLWILLAGTILILVGVLISPLPGPGFTLLGPLGVAVLAAEFVWAKRLLRRMERHAASVNTGLNWFVRRTRLWLAALLFLSYTAGVAVVAISGNVPGVVLWPLTSIGFTITALIVLRSWRRHRHFLSMRKQRRRRHSQSDGPTNRAA